MSFAFMPLYTGDYMRDTQHLSMSEHGCYLKLLMFCWDQRGPAPLDERKLCGIVNARSGDEVETLRRVLREFFVRMEDGWYQPRMQREIERAENVSRARSDAGRKGYEARAKHLLGNNYQASAEQVPSNCQASASTPTPTLTPTPTPTPTKSEATARSVSPTASSAAQAVAAAPVAPSPPASPTARRRSQAALEVEEIGEGDVRIDDIPRLGGGVARVRASAIAAWIEAYPAVMVGQQLESAKLWLVNNPARRKVRVGRFLDNWLRRQQERGR